jgi:hypothetical protein
MLHTDRGLPAFIIRDQLKPLQYQVQDLDTKKDKRLIIIVDDENPNKLRPFNERSKNAVTQESTCHTQERRLFLKRPDSQPILIAQSEGRRPVQTQDHTGRIFDFSLADLNLDSDGHKAVESISTVRVEIGNI